jgi:malate dehydrogenase (oxaloacetate-decarboxylating)
LKKFKTLPIFHDDQHGTAIVVLAGLITALKLAGKEFKDTKIIVNGAGAAGDTIARLILRYGVSGKNLIVCDTKGAIYTGRN